MIKLVDELERGVMDLAAIHSKDHITNAITVKLIEENMSLPGGFKKTTGLETG